MQKNLVIILALVVAFVTVVGVVFAVMKVRQRQEAGEYIEYYEDEETEFDEMTDYYDDTIIADDTDEDFQIDKDDSVNTEDISSDKTETARNPMGWKEVYRDFLQTLLRPDKEGDMGPQFNLVYINDDEIPEIVYSFGTFTTSPATIYTYKDGEVYDLGQCGGYNTLIIYEREGVLVDTYGGTGAEVKDVKEFDGSSINDVISFHTTGLYSGNDGPKYYVGDEEVSEDTYYEMQDRYLGSPDNEREFVIEYPLTEENVSFVLNNVG